MYTSYLTKAIYDLLKSEPYYAHFILDCKIQYEPTTKMDNGPTFKIEKDNPIIEFEGDLGSTIKTGGFVSIDGEEWLKVQGLGKDKIVCMNVPTKDFTGKLLFTNIPTAAVTVRDMRPLIIFNIEFLKQLGQEKIKGVLKHEVLHLCLSHMEDYKTVRSSSKQYYKNIAQDCAINQYIPKNELPEWCVTLESLEKFLKTKLEPFQTSDYYYDKIMEQAEKNEGELVDGSGLKTLDEHMDGDGDEAGTADGKAIRDGVAREAMKKAAQKSAGNVPMPVQKALDIMNSGELPWKTVLKAFIMTKITSFTRLTNKKLNRRFDPPFPGKKRKRKLKVGVCTDSSGSVSDDAYQAFWGEIVGIATQGAEIIVVDADCTVQNVTTIKSKKDIKPERRGNGGTAYQPAIDECMKHKCDIIIYFGDFDTSDAPKDPGVPFLWVGVGDSPPPADFGKVLRIKNV
jgi:predicted metal-dependent peptidase